MQSSTVTRSHLHGLTFFGIVFPNNSHSHVCSVGQTNTAFVYYYVASPQSSDTFPAAATATSADVEQAMHPLPDCAMHFSQSFPKQPEDTSAPLLGTGNPFLHAGAAGCIPHIHSLTAGAADVAAPLVEQATRYPTQQSTAAATPSLLSLSLTVPEASALAPPLIRQTSTHMHPLFSLY